MEQPFTDEVSEPVSPTFAERAALTNDAVEKRHETFACNEEEGETMGKLPFHIKLFYAMPQFSLTSLTMLLGIHGIQFYNKLN
eukprot:gene975-12208_t